MFRVVRAFSQYCFLFEVVFVSHAFVSSPEDHILPFMSDLRFAPDTLFLVAEEDWRLWRADCHRGASTRPEDMPEGREGELSAPSSDAACFQPAEAAPQTDPALCTLRSRREKRRLGEEGLLGGGEARRPLPKRWRRPAGSCATSSTW